MSFIEILDVTLRDGEQTSGVSFSQEEKINISRFLLKDLQVNRVEIASARVSQGEWETAKKIFDWAKSEGLEEQVEILGFVDGNKSVDWISSAGGKVLNLLTKGSLNHCTKQLGKTAKEHLIDIRDTVQYAHEKSLFVNVYLEDWSNGFRHSPDYVEEIMNGLSEMGIRKFFLADTLGVLSPDEVEKGVSHLTKLYPNLHFEFHGHNDYDLACANCLRAVQAGIKGLHVSVNGLGERAGNSPLEAVITSLHDKLNIKTTIIEKEITQASRLVEVFSGKRISGNRPIVGSDVFTQTAGVHADGDKKANLYANPILPERFGRERTYALGKLAGKASISENLKQLGLVLSPDLEKKLLERVIQLGDQNKIVTKEDLPYIIADLSGNSESKLFHIIQCEIQTGIGIKPNAKVKFSVLGDEYQSSATGDGGYDAFVIALKKVLEEKGIELPLLEDYEVRIPPGGKTDALVETVITWHSKSGRPLRTNGVDSDQQLAAVKATEKMINLLLSEISWKK
jgi:D-citramalate synthase